MSGAFIRIAAQPSTRDHRHGLRGSQYQRLVVDTP
jgi:hypothetical protein